METGAELIARERARQITEEGWTEEHDNMHRGFELAKAGAAYAADAAGCRIYAGCIWPWDRKYWKPTVMPTQRNEKDEIRQLVKAGALIAAEIDRLLRWEGFMVEVDKLSENAPRGSFFNP